MCYSNIIRYEPKKHFVYFKNIIPIFQISKAIWKTIGINNINNFIIKQMKQVKED